MEPKETQANQDLYYIQDTVRGVDNSILWCTVNNDHSCDLKKARVWTKEDMDAACKGNASLRAWSKKYIDERIQHHVDLYDVDSKDAKRLDGL